MVKISRFYDDFDSVYEEDSLQHSSIEVMNRIFCNDVETIVNDCHRLAIGFTKQEDVMFEEIGDAIGEI